MIQALPGITLGGTLSGRLHISNVLDVFAALSQLAGCRFGRGNDLTLYCYM